MQQFPTFTGIDISKLTLDICLLQGNSKSHHTIDNEPEAIRAFFIPLIAQCSGALYIGMENTGCYNYHLYDVLGELGLSYYVIPPIHLKKSLGLSRGKNDKVDANRIATFLELNLKNLSSYKPQRAVVTSLQLLLTIRSQRIKIRKQLAGSNEQYQYLPKQDCKPLADLDNELIASIDQQIKSIETQIQYLIANDARLSTCYKLVSSVQGVGKVLSWNLLVRTGEFTEISDLASSLAMPE